MWCLFWMKFNFGVVSSLPPWLLNEVFNVHATFKLIWSGHHFQLLSKWYTSVKTRRVTRCLMMYFVVQRAGTHRPWHVGEYTIRYQRHTSMWHWVEVCIRVHARQTHSKVFAGWSGQHGKCCQRAYVLFFQSWKYDDTSWPIQNTASATVYSTQVSYCHWHQAWWQGGDSNRPSQVRMTKQLDNCVVSSGCTHARKNGGPRLHWHILVRCDKTREHAHGWANLTHSITFNVHGAWGDVHCQVHECRILCECTWRRYMRQHQHRWKCHDWWGFHGVWDNGSI